MAKGSKDNNRNGLDEALAKGLGSISNDSTTIKEDTKNIKSGINSLKSSATSIKKSLGDISKATINSEGELKNISKDTREMRVSLKNIETALKDRSGRTIPDTVSMQEPGSKVMGTVPSPAQQSTALTTVPGSKIAEANKGSTALIAQGKENTEAVKGVGNKITNFFSGKAFWGKMLGTIVDGIIGSKLLSNTLMDVFKLVLYMAASGLRTLFGKHFAGLAAVITTGVASIVGAVLGLRGAFKLIKGVPNFFKAIKMGHGLDFSIKAGMAGARGLKIGSKTVASIAGEETKLLENKVGREAVVKGAEKLGSEEILKIGEKAGGKVLAKKIPFLGWLPALAFAGGRLAKGDLIGAGGEAASGLAGSFAGLGTAASLGVDAWLVKRDFDRASGKGSDDKFIKSMLKMTYSIQKIVNPIVAIAEIAKKIWDWISGGPFSSNKRGRSWGESIHDLFTSSGDLTSDGRIKGTGEDASKILQATRREKESRARADKMVSKLMPGHSIASYFGRRIDPYNKSKVEDHHGIDVAFGKGQSVPAAIGGKVVWSQFEGAGTTGYGNKGYGNTVEILDENTGITYRYHHLSSLGVKAGQYVKRGQAIGVAGSTSSTGRSTGVHLDWEARRKGQFINPAEAAAESLEYEVKSKDSIPTPAVIESKESRKEHAQQIEWLKKQGYTSEQATKEVYGAPIDTRGSTSEAAPNIKDRVSSNEVARGRQAGMGVDTVLAFRSMYGMLS